MNTSTGSRTVTRVRHEVRLRVLEVRAITQLSPELRRITLGGPELAGFHSAAPDDHVKCFFFPPGVTPVAPAPDAPRPPMRDYTPRRHDATRGELDIEFVLHGDGPAATWAAAAKVGDRLLIGGPRGSAIVPYRAAGYLLMGDEAALPAIGRWLDELPAGTPVTVFAEVANAASEVPLATQAALTLHWVHRDGAAPGTMRLLEALQAARLPKRDVYAWVAAETSVSRAIRRYLLEELGVAEDSIKTAGYWKQGVADHHD
ncbi:MAG TPA: siderophore-interacting protein [Steroidobacteraceae bacterium]|nr:siderophore-interacting protein [Steroidobacteraceae bacterium]